MSGKIVEYRVIEGSDSPGMQILECWEGETEATMRCTSVSVMDRGVPAWVRGNPDFPDLRDNSGRPVSFRPPDVRESEKVFGKYKLSERRAHVQQVAYSAQLEIVTVREAARLLDISRRKARKLIDLRNGEELTK